MPYLLSHPQGFKRVLLPNHINKKEHGQILPFLKIRLFAKKYFTAKKVTIVLDNLNIKSLAPFLSPVCLAIFLWGI